MRSPSFAQRATVLLIAASTCVLFSCKKKEAAVEAPAPAPKPPALDVKALGPAALVPGDYETILVQTDLERGRRMLAETKLVSQLLQQPAVRQLLDQSAENPNHQRAARITSELTSRSFFIAGGPGAAEMLKTLREIRDESRFAKLQAQLLSKFSGENRPATETNKEAAAQVLPSLLKAPIPPFLAGFQLPEGATETVSFLTESEQNLPTGVERADLQAQNGPKFRVWKSQAARLMPGHVEAQLRATLAQGGLSEDEVNEELALFRERTFEFAWAVDDGWLYVAAGQDLKHLRFAATPADSLASKPDLAHVAPYQSKPLFGFTYAAPEAIKALQNEMTWVELFDEIAAESEGLIPDEEQKAIREGLAAADKEWEALRPVRIDPAVGAGYLENGYHWESFGGPMPAGKPMANRKLAPPAGNDAALWISAHQDPALTAAAFRGLAQAAGVLYEAAWRIAPEMMEPTQLQQARGMEQLALPKIKAIYQILQELATVAFGEEMAFTLDFGGTIPPLPKTPESLQGKPVAPRAAAVFEVADREKLKELWARTMTVAAEVTMLIPHPAFRAGVPAPQSQQLDGGIMYFYPLPVPIPLGEHIPNLAITDSGFEILSTSDEYTAELIGKLKDPKPKAEPAFVEFQATFDGLWNFAAAVLSPDGGTPAQQQAGGTISALRNIKSASGTMYEENGKLRSSVVVHFD